MAAPSPVGAASTSDAVSSDCPECPAVSQQPAASVMPRAEVNFVPRCDHRHALVRTTRASGKSEEPLVCDGVCGLEIPHSDARWSCHPCDFDLCELCMLARSGPAVYVRLLAEEEKKSREALGKVEAAEERARQAEARLAQAKKAERAERAESKASNSMVDKKAADARVEALEGRAEALERRALAAEAEVAQLQVEVVERRTRSKANLDKMFTARKERDAALAQLVSQAEEANARHAEQQKLVEAAQRESEEARRQLAGADGDNDALLALALPEVAQLEAKALASLTRIAARRASLAEQQEAERQKRADCAVCLVAPRTVAYVPCGHVACCSECAPRMAQCPLCKEQIQKRIPIFLP